MCVRSAPLVGCRLGGLSSSQNMESVFINTEGAYESPDYLNSEIGSPSYPLSESATVVKIKADDDCTYDEDDDSSTDPDKGRLHSCSLCIAYHFNN